MVSLSNECNGDREDDLVDEKLCHINHMSMDAHPCVFSHGLKGCLRKNKEEVELISFEPFKRFSC